MAEQVLQIKNKRIIKVGNSYYLNIDKSLITSGIINKGDKVNAIITLSQ